MQLQKITLSSKTVNTMIAAMLLIEMPVLPAVAQHPSQGLPWVQPSTKSTRSDAFKILFVAHSKCFLHDMPTLFVGLAQQKTARDMFKVLSVYGVSYSLANHLKQNLAVKTIRQRGPWNYVVLFEQSKLPETDPKEFIQSVEQFHKVIKAQGAQPVLVENYDESSTELRRVAKHFGCSVLPIGTAWAIVKSRNPEIRLYSDGHHPSLKGTYLMACVCYAFFLKRKPQDLVDALYINDGKDNVFADPKEAQALQQAAWDAVSINK